MWPVTRTTSDPRGDHGSAAVDFVLVGTLVTLLFLAVIQLGVDYHVRNVLAASVAEGARYGANADVADPAAGGPRGHRPVTPGVGGGYARAGAPPGPGAIRGGPG